MNNYEEIIKMVARETMEEIEDSARIAGRIITFEEMETVALRARRKFGELFMQEMLNQQGTGKTAQKKTVHVARKNSPTKGTRTKR